MVDLANLGFYFDPDRSRVDWDGDGTIVSVNPEWQRREPAALDASRAAFPPLPGHIWLATSGSSATVPGHVRWVALSKGAFLASAAAVNAHLASTSSDVWAHALPVFHVGGLGILARAALSGARVAGTIVGRWDAWRFHERLLESRATLAALVPSQVHDLVGLRLRAPGWLRAVVVGGARLDPELCTDARRLGWPCLPSYGLTESCSQVATAPIGAGLSADCTRPLAILSHAEIRIDDGERIALRGPSLLTCYAEMTDEGLRTWDPKQDGWFHTEDLGRVHASGLEVLGRSGDSVKVLGEMVSIPHLEAVLGRWASAAPAFAGAAPDIAVVALPDARLGHEIVLVLAARGEAGEWEAERIRPAVEAFAREHLLPYERPRRIEWVDTIPRTALGKIQRTLLAGKVGLEPGPER